MLINMSLQNHANITLLMKIYDIIGYFEDR